MAYTKDASRIIFSSRSRRCVVSFWLCDVWAPELVVKAVDKPRGRACKFHAWRTQEESNLGEKWAVVCVTIGNSKARALSPDNTQTGRDERSIAQARLSTMHDCAYIMPQPCTDI